MNTERSTKTYEVAGDMTFERATEVFDSIDLSVIDHDEVTINLSAVRQSDSAALAIMLEWANQARIARKTVNFSHVPDQLMRLIELTRLEKILKLVPAT